MRAAAGNLHGIVDQVVLGVEQVTAGSGEGGWAGQPARFSFRVRPAWWLSWVAVVAYAAVFVLSFIPTIGYILAIAPVVLLAWLTMGGLKALLVLGGLWLVNLLVGNLVAPRLNATSLNLSLATTTVAVIFWAWALGPLGALVAVPLTLLAKEVFFVGYPETRWLADVMSSRVDGG